jgi:hypothetical protein
MASHKQRLSPYVSVFLFICVVLGSHCQTSSPTPSSKVTVTVSGPTGPLDPLASRTFTATVNNTSNTSVTWSVVESGGGSITQSGVYTAPETPGTYTVKAVAQADSSASDTASVPVVIPVGHISGYDVGVCYHAYGTDVHSTAFLTVYHNSDVRQKVLQQLQGMADRGATVIKTFILFDLEPGTTSSQTNRAHFPMSDQEQTNLETYAKDVAAVQGSGGNRLRLDLVFGWGGAADYQIGTPATGLGTTPLTASEFKTRVETNTDKVLSAVGGIKRPDDILVVDSIYLVAEIMIGRKVNEEWLLTANYPHFVSRVAETGFNPAVYFLVDWPQGGVLQDGYIDPDYPILDGHHSMYWVYRGLKFMADKGLFLPKRMDFSYYVTSTGAPYSELLARVLNDADATLPSLGLEKAYGVVETFYYLEASQRKLFGQAFATEASQNARFKRVLFWTTPSGGGEGVNVAYPFAFEDYYPPPGTGGLNEEQYPPGEE